MSIPNISSGSITDEEIIKRVKRGGLRFIIYIILSVAILAGCAQFLSHFLNRPEWNFYDRVRNVYALGERFSASFDDPYFPDCSGFLSDYGLNPDDYKYEQNLIAYIDDTPTETIIVRVSTLQEYQDLDDEKNRTSNAWGFGIPIAFVINTFIVLPIWCRDLIRYLKWSRSDSNDYDDLRRMFQEQKNKAE